MIRAAAFLYRTLLVITVFVMTNAVAEEDQAKHDEETIEEVTAIGARSLSALRYELVRAEDNIYDIFNSLNDDDDYDIICKRETRIGSQIPYRVCKARLFREAAAESAVAMADAATGLTEGAPIGIPGLNEKRHNEILRDKMRALAAENPALIEALRKRFELQKAYESERKQMSR